jgi:hypothetical protein
MSSSLAALAIVGFVPLLGILTLLAYCIATL